METTKTCACGCENTMCARWGRGGSRHASGAGGGAVYGLGIVGAAAYYLQHASTFSAGVIGFLKALVWPAFLVYHLLGFLGM